MDSSTGIGRGYVSRCPLHLIWISKTRGYHYTKISKLLACISRINRVYKYKVPQEILCIIQEYQVSSLENLNYKLCLLSLACMSNWMFRTQILHCYLSVEARLFSTFKGILVTQAEISLKFRFWMVWSRTWEVELRHWMWIGKHIVWLESILVVMDPKKRAHVVPEMQFVPHSFQKKWTPLGKICCGISGTLLGHSA